MRVPVAVLRVAGDSLRFDSSVQHAGLGRWYNAAATDLGGLRDGRKENAASLTAPQECVLAKWKHSSGHCA